MSGGFVQGLWRFPVLGMAGEPLRSTLVETRGVAGDRQHFVAGPEGRLTRQDVPALGGWAASFPFNPDSGLQTEAEPPYPLMVGPGDKRFRWGDPRLALALQRSLSRSVELVRDLQAARGVIVSGVRPELEPAFAGVNVQLALRLPEAGGWAGAELVFRDGVRLKLVASRADGPGIEARVVQAGRILLGEPVALS
jgi:hypothetical protein